MGARKPNPLRVLKADMKVWSRYWVMTGCGSALLCRYCAEEQPLSAAGLPFVHGPDCRRPEDGNDVYPWHVLAALLGGLPMVMA